MEVDRDDDVQNWAKLAPCGGFYLVRTEFYNFLYSTEMVVKNVIRKDNIKAMEGWLLHGSSKGWARSYAPLLVADTCSFVNTVNDTL